MTGLDDLPPLREVIARHGLDARRALGQNFLLDLNLTRRIARAAGPLDGIHVVEIGPGPGGLTRALLESPAASVTAIERDDRCIAALADLVAASAGRLTLVPGDAMEADPAALAPAPRAIVANLPYNIATPLLIGWLRRAEHYARLVLMFQKEVAQRIAAAPGSGAYGRLSVIAQWRCTARLELTLPPRAFTPAPKVESAVVRLEPRQMPADSPPFALMERVTAAAFGQRRKMLRAALKSLTPSPEPLLAAAGIEPTLRAEQVPVEGFVALARAVQGAGLASAGG